MRVLVVEDEEKIAQFLKKGLTEKGYTVETVKDGDAALERYEAGSHDLLILDLLLPGSRDGLELCRELRSRGARAKILMLTASRPSILFSTVSRAVSMRIFARAPRERSSRHSSSPSREPGIRRSRISRSWEPAS